MADKPRCPHDGGYCHHACTATCFRKWACEPLTTPWPGFPVPGDAPVRGGAEDRAALDAAAIRLRGGEPKLRVDPAMTSVEVVDGGGLAAVRALVRTAGELAAATVYDCATAELDLAALSECKLSVEGRGRLARHLGRCEGCMAAAEAMADAMEAERLGKVIDPGRGPRGGVGGSA